MVDFKTPSEARVVLSVDNVNNTSDADKPLSIAALQEFAALAPRLTFDPDAQTGGTSAALTLAVLEFPATGQLFVLIPHVDTTLTPTLAMTLPGGGTQTAAIRGALGADLSEPLRAGVRYLARWSDIEVRLVDGGVQRVAENLAAEVKIREEADRAEVTVIKDGVMPLNVDANGAAVLWLDLEQMRLRSFGDYLDRQTGHAALMTMGTDTNAYLLIDGDGEVYTPGAEATPMAFEMAVDDGGGAIRQVYVATGSQMLRLTAAGTDCLSPRVFARGVIKYAKPDGTIGLARLPRGAVKGGTGIVMVMLHGQSLAGGSASYTPGTPPVVAYPPSTNALMFNGGVRAAFGSGAAVLGNFASLASAQEALDGSTLLSDTGMTGLAFTLSNEIGSDVLVTATGVGGAPYADIKKGTTPWANMLYGVTRGKALADAATRAFSVQSMLWRQGESNEEASRATYRGYIVEAYTDMVSDVVAITGQAVFPLMLVQQINRMEATTRLGTAAFGIDGPGAAVADLATTSPQSGVLVVGPQYVCEFGDQYHMRPASYNLMASYGAKAIRRHLYQGMPWTPLRCVSAARTGKTIIAKFAGGCLDWGGALAIDTSWVTDPGQYGVVFHDRSTDNATARVAAVRAISRTEVEIVLSAEPAGGQLEYVGFAWWASTEMDLQGRSTGLRCCIRDNDPDACPVTGRPLHNYAISHTITVTV